jgi:phosphatidylinositol alpha-mannosyltransferase
VSHVAAATVDDLVPDVAIVPCGIDVATYRMDEPREPTRVVFLGRDEPRKGLDVLLDAWPLVRRVVPEAELVVLGASRRPEPGVRYHGTVNEEQKRRLLAGSAVLVAPNLLGESFGIVLLEGMAAGCAIVASALPAFADVLDGAGMLVPKDDCEALAGSIAALLQDRRLWQQYADLGSRRVQAFDRSRVLDGYLRAYESALAADRRATRHHERVGAP